MLVLTLHSLASEAGSGSYSYGFEDDVAPTSLLNPSSSPECQAPCAKYHAGATLSMEFVCQYQASGLDVAEMQTTGVACMPPYGCRPDWNVCKQKGYPAGNPAAVAACDEIDSLVSGGNSGKLPPLGGWRPTTGGWMKMTGTPDCGWGSTYGNVSPNGEYTLEDYGRVEVDSITTERDCCLEAMKYEGISLDQGGAAIRFGISGGRCLIDREKMMQGNLDTSGGRSARTVDTCGPDGSHLYWRDAAGSADASNLKTGGRCVAEGGFTKVRGAEVTHPMGRLPESNSQELPNHFCSNEDAAGCAYAVRYNTINDAEACCEACRSLEWIADTGGDADPANPCLAWQIVDGKCRILRKEWFESKYGEDGLGRHSTGALAMTVPEVVAACTSESSACERADDSHGHWASCTPGLTPDDAEYAVEDDCHYYSFMYFRSDAALDTGDAVNATYRKIMVVEMTEEDEELGLNITAGIVLLPNRSRLSELQSGEATEVGSGFEAAFEAASVDAGVVSDGSCAQIAVYDASAIDSELSTDDATVFNEESAPEPLCVSVCSKESGKMIEVKCKKEDLEEVRQKDARRRLAEGTPAGPPKLVISFAAVGDGYDTADFYTRDLDRAPDEVTVEVPPDTPEPPADDSTTTDAPATDAPATPTDTPAGIAEALGAGGIAGIAIGGVVGLLLLIGIGVLLVRCANAKEAKVGMGKTPSKQEV